MNIYEKALRRIQAQENDRSKQPRDEGEVSVEAMEKIISHAQRFGHDIREVLDAVLGNFVAYRAIVGKNPSRMDYYEDALKEFLEGIPAVKKVEKLPKGGKNSLHVKRGAIVRSTDKLPHLKSLDLEVEFQNSKKVYVIHKFTQESGGAQDGAMRDALLTLEQSLDDSGRRVLDVMAVLDGNYYQERNRLGLSRMSEAKKRYPSALIGTYFEFEEATKLIWS